METNKTYIIKNREFHTILAALRFYQEKYYDISRDIQEIATNCHITKRLSIPEIDRLCEDLNLGDRVVSPGYAEIVVSGGIAYANINRNCKVVIIDYDVDGIELDTLDKDKNGEGCVIGKYDPDTKLEETLVEEV